MAKDKSKLADVGQPVAVATVVLVSASRLRTLSTSGCCTVGIAWITAGGPGADQLIDLGWPTSVTLVEFSDKGARFARDRMQSGRKGSVAMSDTTRGSREFGGGSEGVGKLPPSYLS